MSTPARILGALGLRLPVFGVGRAGAVPAASQDPQAAKSLREDGTWSSAGGGGGAVSSVFGRTGAVVAQAADYTAAQVSADAAGTAAAAVATEATARAAADALLVPKATLTTDEDVLIRRAGVVARLPVGAEGQVPKVVGGVITWTTLVAAVALDSASVGEVEYNIILLPYGLSATVEAGSFI